MQNLRSPLACETGKISSKFTFFILVLSTLKDASPAKVLIQMNECEPLALFILRAPKFPGFHSLAELISSLRGVFFEFLEPREKLDLPQLLSLLLSGSVDPCIPTF